MTPETTTKKPTENKETKGSAGVGLVYRGIRRHPFVIVLFIILGAFGASAVWFYLPLPKFSGYTVFHIKAQPDGIIRADLGDGKIDFNMYRQSQASLIKSRPIISRVVEQPDIANLSIWNERGDKIIYLTRSLTVDFKEGPELMRVTLEGDNPKELKAVIEAVKKVYLTEVVNKDRAKREEKLKQFDVVYKAAAEKVKLWRGKISKLTENLGSGDPQAVGAREKARQELLSLIERELVRLDFDVLRVKFSVKTPEERVHERNTGASLPDDKALTSLLEADPEYRKLIEKQKALHKTVDETRKNLQPGVNLPSLTLKEAELAQTEKDIDAYATKHRLHLLEQAKAAAIRKAVEQEELSKQNIADAEKLRAMYKLEMETRKNTEKKVNLDQFEMETLRSELAQYEKQANQLFGEMESIRPELENVGRVVVWEEPIVLPGIEGNRRLKYTLIAGIGFLIIGLSITTSLEFRNRRVIHEDDVADSLHLPVIGTVPALPSYTIRTLPVSMSGKFLNWQQNVMESVDNARTLLLHRPEGLAPIRTIMIASALSGEGKTSLSGHLSVSLARAGYRTLLIDADMRRPCLHRVMGVPLTSGLCELLRGRVTPDEVIRETMAPGLSFIPAGMWDPSIPRILAGETWAALREHLETMFDYIIIDTSPILPVADALLLARHVDGVLLSLLHNVSQLAATASAKARLDSVGTNVVGVMINGLNNAFYGYSYSYGERQHVTDADVSRI